LPAAPGPARCEGIQPRTGGGAGGERPKEPCPQAECAGRLPVAVEHGRRPAGVGCDLPRRRRRAGGRPTRCGQPGRRPTRSNAAHQEATRRRNRRHPIALAGPVHSLRRNRATATTADSVFVVGKNFTDRLDTRQQTYYLQPNKGIRMSNRPKVTGPGALNDFLGKMPAGMRAKLAKAMEPAKVLENAAAAASAFNVATDAVLNN